MLTAPSLNGPDFSGSSKSAVYFLAMKEVPFVKIGKADNWETRCREHQCSSPFHMEVIMLIAGGLDVERVAHRLFCESRWRGEWFHYDDKFKEMFAAVEIAKGDVCLVQEILREHQRKRLRYWQVISQAAYSVSDFARELEHRTPPQSIDIEVLQKRRADNRERLRRWRAKKRLEKAA